MPYCFAQRTLRHQFQRYLQTDTNNNVLLLAKLRELVRRKLARDAGMGLEPEGGGGVEISKKEFLDAARAHGITEVDDFLRCSLFQSAGFQWDAAAAKILRH